MTSPVSLSAAALLALAAGPGAQVDSLRLGTPSLPAYWGMPLLETTGKNAALAAFNKWVSRADYGQISLASMRRNLGGGMVWDEDNFVVNQIGHPYQGGLYYSAARKYGHGYYKGLGYAALGSLQWEYLLETEPPAFNDLLTTTLGGGMLGEISYRLSEEIIDNGARGPERFLRESLALLVNPTHGLNRIVSGSAFSSSGPAKPPRSRERPLLKRLSTGGILDFASSGTASSKPGVSRIPKATSEFLVLYGDEFAAEKPYDFFFLNVGMNVMEDPVASVSARAHLADLELFDTGARKGILTLGQNFDYIHSGSYKIAASGFGAGYSHRFLWGGHWKHTFHVQLGGIVLGGANTEFFREGERDYNLGPGAFSTTRIVLVRRYFGYVALVVDRYWLYTDSGAQGNEHIGLGMIEVSKILYKSLGTMFTYAFHDRTARYDSHPTQTRTNQEFRFALTLGLQ